MKGVAVIALGFFESAVDKRDLRKGAAMRDLKWAIMMRDWKGGYWV
jgi:hypothetical protein